MEESDIQLVTKIHNQTVELNTVWDQLFKAYDINNELIDFIKINGMLNQLKQDLLNKMRDAIKNSNDEQFNFYNQIFKKITK